ncbi:4'-phosphopantetheinyl transferase [uncultured Microbulbifer sp.]|uniref:4'-phosphopantetheinyl transferase family protein n=1 Tax=uncultured Microbulbifer sp. TaxID=348147 RepID=UPI00261F025B|nr:4'-phosphopantetheinyl transferase superfamily protein [uncultured Microbulbifer sp.]
MPIENAFIGRVHSEAHEKTGARLVSCEFDSANYQPALYRELGVSMPDSIARSVPRRQAEFLAGRYVAAQALRDLMPAAYHPEQVGIGPDRNPIWPDGVIGSISHEDGVAVCALSGNRELDYLGIDVAAPMSATVCREVGAVVASPRERALLDSAGLPEQIALTLTFSAKESLFKALYPWVHEYFGFEVAEATALHLDAGTLSLRLTEHFAAKHKLPRDYECQFTQGEHWIQSVTSGKFPAART